VGEILIDGPGREGGWRPTYEPSSECDLSDQTTQPIVAYRMWQVRHYRHCPGGEVTPALCGTHPLCPAQWRERGVAAYCLSRPIAGRAGAPELAIEHDTPSPDRTCTCGVSAFYEPFESWGVSGVVALSGYTVLHDIWLRSARARIECFALGARVTGPSRDFIAQLASEWSVPIVARGELGSFARSVGSEVPRLLRPTRQRDR
jgi:hypothetical protein